MSGTSCSKNHQKGMAARVPKVPGALGAQPEPKPKANRCTGLRKLGLTAESNSVVMLKLV